ncbi:MAG: MBL fold metallo-hydrolase [Pseudomonadota bacterium]
MRLTFANSATIAAPGWALSSGVRGRQMLRVRYGVISHPDAGVVLIDTGYSAEALTASGRGFALRAYGHALRPKLVADQQIPVVLKRLGHTMSDVKTIIVTHFHADHVAALNQFPKARIIADKSVAEAILSASPRANLRHSVFSELLPNDLLDRTTAFDAHVQTDGPLGLGACFDLLGDGRVLGVPLPGHADGHWGVVFPLEERPLLYACDAQWMQSALTAPRRPLLEHIVSTNKGAARETTRRVAAFQEAGGQVMLCHDPNATPYDFESMS